MKSLEYKILKNMGIEKAYNEHLKNERRKHLNEDRKTYERRKWRKELEKYNRENNKNVFFCYELSQNVRLPVNRGKYNIDFWRREEEKNKREKRDIRVENVMLFSGNKIIMKRAIVENTEKFSIVRIYLLKENMKLYCKLRKFEDLPEKVKINGEEYEKKDLETGIINYKVKICEVKKIERKEEKQRKLRKVKVLSFQAYYYRLEKENRPFTF